jgi:hypothetical protein
MATIIASVADTDIGVGTLLRWDEDEIEYSFNKEEGCYIVKELKGDRDTIRCYDLMKLEANLLGADIEECDISHLRED